MMNIGSGINGAAKVLKHPWFESVAWDTLVHMKPPFRPIRGINTQSQSDIGHFADDANNELTEDEQELYANWDFTNKSHFQKEIVCCRAFEEHRTNVSLITCGISSLASNIRILYLISILM